jgi:hypothetical protein
MGKGAAMQWSEYSSLGTLNKGAAHAYLILGVKFWAFNLGGFGIESFFLVKAYGMCLGMGWSMPLGISWCSMKENLEGFESPKL